APRSTRPSSGSWAGRRRTRSAPRWRRRCAGIASTRRGGGRSSPASSAHTTSGSTAGASRGGGAMSPRLTAALLLPMLVPATLALARPTSRAPHHNPRDVSAVPTYVQRMEPALVGLHVPPAEDRPSAARLRRPRVGTALRV